MSPSREHSRLERSLTILFLAVVAGLMVAAAITLQVPKKYRSAATLQVKGPETAEGRDSIILSKEILYPVIDTLNLVKKWEAKDRDEVFRRLRNELSVREIRNTELIQINAIDTDPKFAAQIADAVAEEYQRQRIAEQQETISKALRQLQDEVEEHRKEVEEIRAIMARVRSEMGVSDLNPERSEDAGPKGGSYYEIKIKYLQAKKVLEAAELRLSTETMQRAMPQSPVIIWERAEPAQRPSSPLLARNLLIGGLAGLVAGIAIALVIK